MLATAGRLCSPARGPTGANVHLLKMNNELSQGVLGTVSQIQWRAEQTCYPKFCFSALQESKWATITAAAPDSETAVACVFLQLSPNKYLVKIP